MAKIRSKKELDFYLKADYMMNTGKFRPSLLDRLMDFFFPNYIMHYLTSMRYYSYYSHLGGAFSTIKKVFYRYRIKKLGVKLNFSIGPDTLGYGVRIPHHGTIVVGDSCSIGNYAVLHTSICITGNGKKIGDGLYVSTGAKLTSGKKLADNVAIAANSVVTKDFEESNVTLVGMPAVIKKSSGAWYENNEVYQERVRLIEDLKKQVKL